MSLDTRLARTLAARLCHDLGGVVGTLAGTLGLVGSGDPEMLGLAQDTAAALRARLRLYAAAWAGNVEDCRAEAIAALLAGAPAADRVRFDLSGLALAAPLPADLVPILLNAALLGAEALPRGGTLHLSGCLADGFAVLPEGRNAAWPAGVTALLAGDSPAAALEEGPRRVLAPLLASLVAEAGWSMSLAFGPDGGVPILMLAPG